VREKNCTMYISHVYNIIFFEIIELLRNVIKPIRWIFMKLTFFEWLIVLRKNTKKWFWLRTVEEKFSLSQAQFVHRWPLHPFICFQDFLGRGHSLLFSRVNTGPTRGGKTQQFYLMTESVEPKNTLLRKKKNKSIKFYGRNLIKMCLRIQVS
jgi:hypothetical protein